MSSCHYLMIRVFQCEDSLTGILTGVYDGWASRLGHSHVRLAMGVLPQWIITGFSVAGGLLPALGFAIIIITIGRKDLLAYFFIGFFAVAYLGINTMAAAVFGGCIAVLVTINARKNKKGAAA